MQAISSNRQWKKNKEQFAAMNPMISLFGRSNNWTLPLWEGIFFYRLFGFWDNWAKEKKSESEVVSIGWVEGGFLFHFLHFLSSDQLYD